ncbi:Lipopolysaccharide heptosyltransferase I [hydrothermal vent metagenome]|uniref:Lipopolysaccharide heptosyltransferase 1 n=1 Tax=hydrothermal vent metagenome TaxID=652676 RepID=A0A1W1BRQ9_9ZZZZ
MIKRIAIVRLSALGDIVNSAFVLQFIKQVYKDVQITWICEEVFAPIFNQHPYINQIHTLNLKKLKKNKSFSLLKQEIGSLRKLGDFDIVIDMQGLLKSAIVSRLISPNTHGFDKDSIRESIASIFYKTTTHIPYSENVILRNAKVVGDALGFSITKEMIEQKERVFPLLYQNPFDTQTKHILFVIGASWESKRYPKERVIEVIYALDAKVHILWGNKTEKADAEYIVSKTKNAKLTPKMSLDELVSFISYCDLVIGNDTGPTHMAWAQNVPSITIFGPTNERMIFETSKNVAIHSDSKVDILKIDKNDYSIREIEPKRIIDKAKELL